MKNKYRIVRDNWSGFEVQIKRWWLPFWYQINSTNTSRTVEEAENKARRHSCPFVKYIDI